MYKKVFLKKGHDRRIKNGHLWIFSNELTEVIQIEAGTIVEVCESNSNSLGLGFYNPNSLIAVRLLLTTNEINFDFFKSRIKTALDLRTRIIKSEDMTRIVFGESDLIPGLIVDKFGDYLAIQSLSAGIEKNLDIIISVLLDLIPNTKGIILKNNSQHRINEGLELSESVVFGEIPEEIICSENNIKFSISLSESQKTGFYLDQKVNRLFVRSISKGLSVLDCYTNQGGFALNALLGGAKDVTAIDVSDFALNKVSTNATLNDMDAIATINSDVPDFLKSEIELNHHYDLVILDPPSFTKNKKNLHTAIAGYKKINRLALKIINDGGFLVSSSCTHHLNEDVFEHLISEEAAKQGIYLQIIHRGMQAGDHPILIGMPETKYLKFYIFRVVK